ncbi:hypothetical protein HDU86_007534 [Geranomyces michiganensis]|nr:hypothetical protein HDU86_007534 [Geranomyces michiganensis]
MLTTTFAFRRIVAIPRSTAAGRINNTVVLRPQRLAHNNTKPATHIPQTAFSRKPTSTPPSGIQSMDPQEGGVLLKNEGKKPKDGFIDKAAQREKQEEDKARAAEEKIKPQK